MLQFSFSFSLCFAALDDLCARVCVCDVCVRVCVCVTFTVRSAPPTERYERNRLNI